MNNISYAFFLARQARNLADKLEHMRLCARLDYLRGEANSDKWNRLEDLSQKALERQIRRYEKAVKLEDGLLGVAMSDSDTVSNVIKHGGTLRIGIVSLSFGKSKKLPEKVYRVLVGGKEEYSSAMYQNALSEFESQIRKYVTDYPNVD